MRAGSVCGSGAALARGCVRPVPVVRFYRNVVCLFAPIMRSFRNVVCLFAPIMRSFRNVVCLFAPIMRSSRNVLRSITPAVCRMAPNRTACGMLRSYSAVGRDRRSCVLESLVRLSRMVGLIWDCEFPYGDLDGGRKGQGNAENGVGGAAWVRFCVNALALLCFPRGVRWGEMWKPHCGRAPDCAKEPLALWTLFLSLIHI